MRESVFYINVVNDCSRLWETLKVFQIHEYKTNGQKSRSDNHIEKKMIIITKEGNDIYGLWRCRWTNPDKYFNNCCFLKKKYSNLSASVALLLITSHPKAWEMPIYHSETFNSLWTGNITENFISDCTDDSIRVPEHTKLYNFIPGKHHTLISAVLEQWKCISIVNSITSVLELVTGF